MVPRSFVLRCTYFLCSFSVLCTIVLLFQSSDNKNDVSVLNSAQIVVSEEQKEFARLEKLRRICKCVDSPYDFERVQHGEFWILKNYIRARHGEIKCHETITMTTHGDFTFLDNLGPIVSRWQAPVSIAIHAPGSDFNKTLESIKYTLNCLPESELIQQFVTFHIYFPRDHLPKHIPQSMTEFWETGNAANCSNPAPYLNVDNSNHYKVQKKLTYPINLGRNIARRAALTHFVFANDIELFPSPGLVRQFQDMVIRNESVLHGESPRVFPLAVFEVDKSVSLPNNKTELQNLLTTKKAILFHKKICKICHEIPNYGNWTKEAETDQLEVFSVAKRTGKYKYWEPFYIGTNAEPIFDERVTWEGQKNKMIQCFALCLLDYEFHVLNNAFLVHRPGIKDNKPNPERQKYVREMNKLVSRTIKPQLETLYGSRAGCVA